MLHIFEWQKYVNLLGLVVNLKVKSESARLTRVLVLFFLELKKKQNVCFLTLARR